MSCSSRLQVGWNSVGRLFSHVAVNVTVHCCAFYTGLCWMALCGASWKAHLCVLVTTAAREALSFWSWASVAALVWWHTLMLDGRCGFSQGFELLWEGLKLMMIKWDRFLYFLSEPLFQGHSIMWPNIWLKLVYCVFLFECRLRMFKKNSWFW